MLFVEWLHTSNYLFNTTYVFFNATIYCISNFDYNPKFLILSKILFWESNVTIHTSRILIVVDEKLFFDVLKS